LGFRRNVVHIRNIIGSFRVRHRAGSTLARFEFNLDIGRVALRQSILVLSY
jgi:hypothetical protein